MVIDDFNRMRMPLFPDEADAPLVVNADAVLARPSTLEGFEAVAWRHTQVTQGFRRRELRELTEGNTLNIGGEPPGSFALPDLLRLFVAEILNHPLIL